MTCTICSIAYKYCMPEKFKGQTKTWKMPIFVRLDDKNKCILCCVRGIKQINSITLWEKEVKRFRKYNSPSYSVQVEST